MQVFLGVVSPPACVYALGGRSKTYIGFTGNSHRSPGVLHLGLPARRTGEHLRDLLLGHPTASQHKAQILGADPRGSLFVYVVSFGGARQMAALERCLIRMVSPPANTTFAHRRGWRVPPAEAHAPQHAAPRRRPPARLRDTSLRKQGPLEAALAGLEKSAAATRRQRARCGRLRTRRRTPRTGAHPWAGISAPSTCSPLRRWTCWCPTSLRGRSAVAALRTSTASAARSFEAGDRGAQAFMASIGELPWSFAAIRMPADAGTDELSECARRALWACAAGVSCRYRWLRERVRICRGPARRYGQRFGMQRACRAANVTDLDSVPEELRRRALDGTDMTRIKRYWKLAVPGDPALNEQMAAAELEHWLASYTPRAALPRRSESDRHRAIAQMAAEPLARQVFAPPSAAYSAYAAALPVPVDDLMLAIEDKDPSSAWICDRTSYLVRALHYIEHDQSWTRTALTKEQVGRYLRALFADLIRRGVLPRTAPARWAGAPELYVTVKAKCRDTASHTCARPPGPHVPPPHM